MSLRMAALGLLARRPASGYDLLRQFQDSLANVWSATQSQLYGELNRLADAGLIEVCAVGPRGRKEYRITTAGRDELRRWLLNPQDDPPFRSAPLLRVFLLGELGRDQARAYLTALAEQADAEVQRLTAVRDAHRWDGDAAAFYARAVLEYGLRANAMQADWARWVLDRGDVGRGADPAGNPAEKV
ncbi:PadR family transcriptional regulator [Mycolicibacterium hassiacum]|nr:PadR family transcriptional regulator [Mycolicibacterium hassiacum]MBX5489428.1 PadR family transcriptional regulator [Mycolicibacterium hassiacum]MDA4086863.1 PadR family transcriptional regulator [Mycolicibacterium hassiacum DSM 44199]